MSNKVNVYENGQIVARVEWNTNLDVYDGNNWNSGSRGCHKGITRLKDGRFALIHSYDWQGERAWSEIVDDDQAIQEILESDNDDLLEKFDLVEKAKNMLIPEDE